MHISKVDWNNHLLLPSETRNQVHAYLFLAQDISSPGSSCTRVWWTVKKILRPGALKNCPCDCLGCCCECFCVLSERDPRGRTATCTQSAWQSLIAVFPKYFPLSELHIFYFDILLKYVLSGLLRPDENRRDHAVGGFCLVGLAFILCLSGFFPS